MGIVSLIKDQKKALNDDKTWKKIVLLQSSDRESLGNHVDNTNK